MRRHARGLLGFVLLGFVTACGGAVDVEASAKSHSSRFVGLWNVAHVRALVDEAFYRFDADGRLTKVSASCMDAVGGEPCVNGAVASCRAWDGKARCEPTTCTFGDRWFSEGETILAIEGVCSDGRPRTIRVEFTEDRSRNAAYYPATRLHSVGDDTSWVEAKWPLGFRKCEGLTEASCRR
jgi:hypothetical protein